MLCKQQSDGCQSLFNHSNENMNMSVFFVDCPKIPFWSVLSLNCCRLFKINSSYIISKCKSVKMINIPRFLIPHFYLLSVQSYKRLKLSESIISQTSLGSYFVSWKYFSTYKKICLYEQQWVFIIYDYANDYSIPYVFAIEALTKMYFVELIFAM